MRCLSRRIADGHMLSVIKQWLRVPVVEHTEELAAHPADWMPWNYHDTLVKQTAPSRQS
jgi:hypothetical protein